VKLNHAGDNADEVLATLKRLETQLCPLEEPRVEDLFFSQIQNIMVDGDLDGINPSLLQNEYPHLCAHFDNEIEPYDIRQELLSQANKKKPVKARPPKEKKKFMYQLKFEKYMNEKEAAITCHPQFRANPIPASSIIPKYQLLMTNTGNKAAELRLKAATEKRNILEMEPKSQPKAKLRSRPRVSVTAIEDGKRKREILLANEKNAGLTEEHTFKPKLADNIPDFEMQQRRFEQELQSRKSERPATCKS
jgi:hypothetical protein